VECVERFEGRAVRKQRRVGEFLSRDCVRRIRCRGERLPEFGADGWAKTALEILIRKQLARGFIVGENRVSKRVKAAVFRNSVIRES
jgi:hypothetical protein